MCYVVFHFWFVVTVGKSWCWLHFCYDAENKYVGVQPHNKLQRFSCNFWKRYWRDLWNCPWQSGLELDIWWNCLLSHLTSAQSVCKCCKIGSLVLPKHTHQIVWVSGLLLLPEHCSVWCSQFWYSGHFVSLILLCQSHTPHCIRSLWAVAHVESSLCLGTARVKSKR